MARGSPFMDGGSEDRSLPGIREIFPDHFPIPQSQPAARSIDDVTEDDSSTHALLKHDEAYANRKYVCKECHRRFLRPSSLKTHLIIHTGEKPYECPIADCGKRYSTKSNMKRHARSHRHKNAYPSAEPSRERESTHNQHSFTHAESSSSAVHYSVMKLTPVPLNPQARSSTTTSTPPLIGITDPGPSR